ncbi:hypothetical protein [Pseudoalteromonas sp. NBT06-2]|uniref:hypothetical protein n=1 Tax=Pseudoalteromonas sp. NBT06-2 TaxID=2025950 RepID=UPI001140E34D|nr:hypothetical protein [Pseudoalteromonas sp. NBT06-2]
MLVVACMDVGTRAMQEHIAGPSFFKGVTINAKMRLDHELLSSPEPHILKWLGYIPMLFGFDVVAYYQLQSFLLHIVYLALLFLGLNK